MKQIFNKGYPFFFMLLLVGFGFYFFGYRIGSEHTEKQVLKDESKRNLEKVLKLPVGVSTFRIQRIENLDGIKESNTIYLVDKYSDKSRQSFVFQTRDGRRFGGYIFKGKYFAIAEANYNAKIDPPPKIGNRKKEIGKVSPGN